MHVDCACGLKAFFPCHLEIRHRRRRTGAPSLKNKPEQTYSYCVFWSGRKGTYGLRNFDRIARNGRLSAESRRKPNVLNADFYISFSGKISKNAAPIWYPSFEKPPCHKIDQSESVILNYTWIFLMTLINHAIAFMTNL